MGRFSKLETGAPAPSQAQQLDAGLAKVRRPKKETEGPRDPDYDQGHYIGEADNAFYQGDYQKALRQYSRAMQVDSSAIEPWIGQVLCLVELKQHREAAVWALRSLELFPEDPRLVSLQGLTYALNGTTKRALACSDYAISRPIPATAFVWAVRGHILSLADNANAAFCFDKAMEVRQRDDWRTPLRIGLLLLGEKKWSRAAEFLQIAAEVNQRNPTIWKKLGYAKERLGMSQAALEAYQAALHLNVADREAEDCLARLTNTSLPTRLWRRMFRK